MKNIKTLLLLLFCNSILGQDTLSNENKVYSFPKQKIKYELSNRNFQKKINPFSKDEFLPYLNLELSAEKLILFRSGIERESDNKRRVAQHNFKYLAPLKNYQKTSWAISSNFDKEESMNFYKSSPTKNIGEFGKSKISRFGLVFPNNKFSRSAMEWKFSDKKFRSNINFSFVNNVLYKKPLDNFSLLDSRFNSFLPKRYYELLQSEWVQFEEFLFQNINSYTIFAKLFLSPVPKIYIKYETDLVLTFFLSNQNFLFGNQSPRIRYETFGIGYQPVDETVVFLDLTNRYGFALKTFHYTIQVRQALKFKLFKRKNQ